MYRLRFPAPWLALAGFLLSYGCGSDSAPSPSGPDDGIVETDTSSLRIQRLTYTAYDQDGNVETGLALQWILAFHSTTGRDCRISSYRLANALGEEIFVRHDPIPQFISSGGELHAKERWIPVDGPTSTGDYVFSVFFVTGHLLTDTENRSRWNGPLSSGRESMSFTAVAVNTDTSTTASNSGKGHRTVSLLTRYDD